MQPHADRPQPPADQGLSSLGLIMTLTGTVMAPLVGAMTLGNIRAASERGAMMARSGAEGDTVTLWLFLILIAGVVRSLVQRMAGIRLWRDVPTDPPALSGINTYAIAAAAHTALICLFLKVHDAAGIKVILGVAAFLMAWPVAILLVTRQRRFQALGPRPPLAEDNGFEGLAVLMAILGFAGLVCSVMVVVLGVSVRDEARGTANVFVLCGVALVVRSIIHFSVGARAVRGTAPNAAADFLRYGDVGTAIGAGVGGLLTLWLFTKSLDFFAMALGLAVMIALMAWPTTVRRFVSWRHLADVATDTVRRRSPDAGITALGWLLLAGASFALSSYLADLLWAADLRPRSTQLVNTLGGVLHDVEEAWYTLPLALAQLWAALELLAVTPRRRAVASAWAVATLAVTFLTQAGDLSRLMDEDLPIRAAGFAAFFLAITPAVATLLLVNRVAIPPAIARVKS